MLLDVIEPKGPFSQKIPSWLNTYIYDYARYQKLFSNYITFITVSSRSDYIISYRYIYHFPF